MPVQHDNDFLSKHAEKPNGPALIWQDSLRQAYRSPQALLRDLGLEAHVNSVDGNPRFPFLVTHEFVSKMRRGDINDPLLRQVLPLKLEAQAVSGFIDDPTEDAQFHAPAGLLKKYAHRALLIATGGCAINCRYCFRREFPYQSAVGSARLEKIFESLSQDREISELILSGGDPLILSDDKLRSLTKKIAKIDHIQRLRIHTRLPVVLPQRLTKSLRMLLTDLPFRVALVMHSNHANEIDSEVTIRLRDLHAAGVNLFNQAVLLRGVNDNASSQVSLAEKLFDANVVPYYVHLLDPVSGSAHFAVPLERAQQIETQLRQRLPGYLVPQFVREIPGADAKTPLHLL